MRTDAVVMEKPGRVAIEAVRLADPGADDVVVSITASAISSGTESLLWRGRMPEFPGMGYPLVPGYEAIGRVVEAGAAAATRVGTAVFVPGSAGFRDVRGLFGAAARELVVPACRVVANDIASEADGVLLALAATAHHAMALPGVAPPELIVGHGVLGRLVARIAIARGAPPPTVWETDPARRDAQPYPVIAPDADLRRDYATILDASGDAAVLPTLVERLARGGEIVLAGFYPGTIAFPFAPAFMREARFRIAAEWTPADMAAVLALIERGALSLAGLVTDTMPAAQASAAYERAFTAPDCLKMVLDWSR